MKPQEIVEAWSNAIQQGDWEKARTLAYENLAFRGPIDTFNRVDDYLAALKNLGAIVKGADPEITIAQGNQVALFYILRTKVADAPVAEWYTVDHDKISAIRAYFDARPFAPPAGATAGSSTRVST